MKLLITGAQGFLGAVACERFRQGNHRVTAVGRRPAPGITVCDLANPAQLAVLLATDRPEVIVNCAARVDFGEGSLVRQLAPNTLAPGFMSVWCAQNGVHLVHCSTALIHGARVAQVTADTPVAPDTDYGRSKTLAEELIAASGCRAALIRIGGIFGARGSDHLGLNRAIRAAREGQRPRLVGRGVARRNYVHVDDAAKALKTAVENNLAGVFRLAGAETLTMADMLQTICDIYLPGLTPEQVQGPEAADQLIDVSPELAPSRNFADALRSEV